MPNWCMNNLTISHSDPSMLQRFVDAYNRKETCQEFLPVPDGYYDDERWYNWCIDNWGTKWDFGKDDYNDPATIEYRMGKKNGFVGVSFNTAWSPPVDLYNHLVDSGFIIRATYFEPGMAFCGIYEDGCDNYVEYTNKEMIPVTIWNDYALDDFFEMIEE